MTITILCAGALALPAGGSAGAAELSLPEGALARRSMRARLVRYERNDAPVPDELPYEAWLRERFGIAGSVAGCALSAGDPHTSSRPAPADNTVGNGGAALPDLDKALLIRPVHLHVGLDHLRLAPPHLLDIDAAQAQALAHSANQMLADSGLSAHVVQPDAWALTVAPGADAAASLLAELAALHARSARMAEGRQIDVYLPDGAAARQWRRLSTEVQMAWFEHPVNRQRDERGHAAINSLWLEGRPGHAALRPFDRVVASDPAIIGLTRSAGIDCRVFVDTLLPVMAGVAHTQPHAGSTTAGGPLIAFDLWRHPTADGDLHAWRQAWQTFADWFERNEAALAAPLHLVLTGERSLAELHVAALDRWAFWRRRRLADLLETDA